jgi:hypothetical protein
MYRRPKFLEVLLEIRQEMARDADYDVDLFVEMVRSGKIAENEKIHALSESESSGEKVFSPRLK